CAARASGTSSWRSATANRGSRSGRRTAHGGRRSKVARASRRGYHSRRPAPRAPPGTAAMPRRLLTVLGIALPLLLTAGRARAQEADAFAKEIRPLLEKYCYAC